MNERIQELYAQAIQYADSVVPANNRYNDIYYAIASGKHAELIVRECISAVEQGLIENPPEGDKSFCQGSVNGCKLAVSDIKQHFGVE